jgi:hypothetical protein
MWMARNAKANSETLRWSPSTTKRGQRSLRQRMTSTIPRTSAPVNKSSETAPDPRVKYQYGLGEEAMRINSSSPLPASHQREALGRGGKPVGSAT